MKKNGKYCKGKKSMNMKPLAVLLALTLLVGCAVGGTLAWLTAKTSDVQNTFSPSDITIELKEHKYDAENDRLTDEETSVGVSNYKMVPGWTIPKDPWATVKTGSEDCYLFVKVQKSRLFDAFMEYDIAATWTELASAAGPNFKVYYMTFDNKDTAADKPVMGTEYPVLKDNKVTVKSSVTKEMMGEVTEDVKPTVTFTAYAVQLYKSNSEKFTPEDAWKQTAGYVAPPTP